MEYLVQSGFLGTDALLYTDVSAIYLILLPVLMGLSISFAMKVRFKSHRLSQTILLLLAIIALASFNYGIRIESTLAGLMAGRSIHPSNASFIVMAHTIFSVLLLVLWISTLLFASADRRRRALPGLYSSSHKTAGRRVFLVALFHAFSMAYCYWMIYIA